MGGSPSIGTLFPPAGNVRDLPGTARRLEELGIDELWVAEDCFMAGGISAAATALAVTERLQVGVGLLPVSVRNAAFAAMELATLAEIYPGRFRAAFGHGVEAWMRQVGARPANRIVALEEVVGSVRALLRGERVTRHGRSVEPSRRWARPSRRRRRGCHQLGLGATRAGQDDHRLLVAAERRRRGAGEGRPASDCELVARLGELSDSDGARRS
jgi:alkanesulfonate monooxygenase SsuD/methylene tetrahydromethanopterin reductase-like flavin-dependent oxidoreductase (luciferase family)